VRRIADKEILRWPAQRKKFQEMIKHNFVFALIGSILIVVGVAAMIHPQFSYRVSQHVEQTGPMKVEYEMRRIIRLPLWFSIPILTIGAALVVGGFREE
jgi:hypothetical protein